MRISRAVLVVLLSVGSIDVGHGKPAGRSEATAQGRGSVSVDPCKAPDPKASKSDLMKLWFTITTTTPTPSDLTPDHWPSLCPATVSSVAPLVLAADTKKVVSQYAGWYRIVKSLAVINGQYDQSTANRIWILGVSRQDAFATPEVGLKTDIEELFHSLPGSPKLPSGAPLNIASINRFVSGNRASVGPSFTQVRGKFVQLARQAQVRWGGHAGHPSGFEVATLYP
jgi:hypothetical protein